MKKFAFLACFLGAFLTFGASQEELAKGYDQYQQQYRQYVMARFNHAYQISSGKTLDAAQQAQLEKAINEFTVSIYNIYVQNKLSSDLLKVYQTPEFKAMHQQLLATKNRTEYITVTKAINQYLDENFRAFENPQVDVDARACAMKFLKAVEDLPGMPKLNEKTEFRFWLQVLFPYMD